MEQVAPQQQTADPPGGAGDGLATPATTSMATTATGAVSTAQANGGSEVMPGPEPNGSSDGGRAQQPSYVYALGRVEPRFPSLAAEKEFAQVTGRAETAGLSDRQALQSVLADRQNRYLVRQLCWVLTIEGLETYILVPRDPADFDMLVEAVRPTPRPADVDIVIGVRGPIAPPEVCNGLMVPIVVFDQI